MGGERDRGDSLGKIICSRRYGRTLLWPSPGGNAAAELFGDKPSPNRVQLHGITSGELRTAAQLPCFPGFWEKRTRTYSGAAELCDWICGAVLYVFKWGPRKEERVSRFACPGALLPPWGAGAAALRGPSVSLNPRGERKESGEGVAVTAAAVRGPKELAAATSVPQSRGMCTLSPSLAASRSCE